MAVSKIAFISSNQHQNPYRGFPGVTEEQVLQDITNRTITRLKLRTLGVDVRNFHVAGTGTSSVDELKAAVAQANAFGPDVVLSLHSDAVGDAAFTGIMPIVYSEARRAVGENLAQGVAARLKVSRRRTMIEPGFIVLNSTKAPAYLLEISEHATYAEAGWILNNRDAIAEAVCEAMIYTFKLSVKPVEQPPAPEPEDPAFDAATAVAALDGRLRVVELAVSDLKGVATVQTDRIQKVQDLAAKVNASVLVVEKWIRSFGG